MQPIMENMVNTPAFLGKLWKMVNDPSTDHLICWSAAGNSFVIQNQAQFWYELLPLYYKHNNMSSFVRQLNMYGFHKMSTVENGTMDADKDEIQFTHPYFQKDQPELLRNIKRKATTSKSAIENANKHDELTKLLTDVKQLRGRQVNVDNQLSSIKQENALLWREVAILRQKHIKQQKIVNKLIQFLVTLVQPSRMTVGVKRGYQLMLNECPNKKAKTDLNNKNKQLSNGGEGPIIREVDNEIDLTPNLYEEDPPLISSPATSTTSQQTDLSSPLPSVLLVDGNGDQGDVWDKPEFVSISSANSRLSPDGLLLDNDLSDDNLMNTLENDVTPTLLTRASKDKVFLNPSTQDTLLSNLIKRNDSLKNGKTSQSVDPNNIQIKIEPLSQMPSPDSNMTIATRDNSLNDVIKSMPSTSDAYSEDLSTHVETTQAELDELKDILNGYNNYVDTNALLGLFSDSPTYDANSVQEKESGNRLIDTVDPMVSGSELTPYGNNFDFDELLYDDDLDQQNVAGIDSQTSTLPSSTVNTPPMQLQQPIYPTLSAQK